MAHTIPTRFTKGQMDLQKYIESKGLQTILEYKVEPFILDIFLPELNKAVEYDGKPFHGKRRDEKRDKYILETYKIQIFRYKSEEDKEELNKFLEREGE